MAMHYSEFQTHVWPKDRTKGFSREEIEALLGGPVMRWPINHPIGCHLFIQGEAQLTRNWFNQTISEIAKCSIYGHAMICAAKEWREDRKLKTIVQTPKGPGIRTIPSLGELVERELDDDLKNMFRKDRGMAPVILGVQACRNTHGPTTVISGMPMPAINLPAKKKRRAK